MGSICAVIKSVERDLIEIEIQNEGHIYENSQVSFSGESGDILEGEASKEDLLTNDIRFCVENDVDYII